MKAPCHSREHPSYATTNPVAFNRGPLITKLRNRIKASFYAIQKLSQHFLSNLKPCSWTCRSGAPLIEIAPILIRYFIDRISRSNFCRIHSTDDQLKIITITRMVFWSEIGEMSLNSHTSQLNMLRADLKFEVFAALDQISRMDHDSQRYCRSWEGNTIVLEKTSHETSLDLEGCFDHHLGLISRP